MSNEIPLLEQPPSRRGMVVSVAGLVTSLSLTALTVMPSPYAIEHAGPTYDTLARAGDVPLVSIAGATTYDTTGELRLTTVSVSNAATQWFTAGQVIEAYFSPAGGVTPAEFVFGTPGEEQQQNQASAEQWITSQESAAVSALTAQGVTVPASFLVAEVMPESDAVGVLEVDDVLLAADGENLTTYQDLTAFLDAHKPGDEVTFTVRRADQSVDATFDLIALDDDPTAARIGIFVDPTFDLPIDVEVAIDKVGGPSAGLMFALAIMDKLTPEDELDGALIAGTGEIDVEGDVHPIGGIRFKMAGAKAAGAEYFLAPIENCDEVVGHVPAGLSVYAVDGLSDAYKTIVAIGKHDTASLPTCDATTTE